MKTYILLLLTAT